MGKETERTAESSQRKRKRKTSRKAKDEKTVDERKDERDDKKKKKKARNTEFDRKTASVHERKLIVQVRGFDDELSADGIEDLGVEHRSDEEVFFNLLRLFGELELIVRVDIPRHNETKRRLGHAVIEFKKESDWKKALAMNGTYMLRKKITVTDTD